jgi:hypothetical protein
MFVTMATQENSDKSDTTSMEPKEQNMETSVELKVEVKEEPTEGEDLKALDATSKPVRGKGHRVFNEDPFLPFPDHMLPAFENIKQHYGLRDDFPVSNFIVRSENSPKIYLVSPSVSEILNNDERKVIRVINTGIKTFMKHDAKDLTYDCQYRICQEGLNAILPFVSKRIVTITEADFMILLTTKDPFIKLFSESVKNTLNSLSSGSLIFMVDPTCNKKWAGMASTGWKGKVSCHLLLPKEEIAALKNLWNIANPSETKPSDKNGNGKEEVVEPL